MRLSIVFYLIFLTQTLIEAQGISDGVYVNEKTDEFVCFYNDTIQFRISNQDGFRSFSIGKGKYKANKRGIYHLLPCNSISEQISKVKRYRRNDSLVVIKALHKDSTPNMFAYVYIDDVKSKKGSILAGICNKNGSLSLSADQINKYTKKKLFIQIESLESSTKNMAVLERGYDYEIWSILPRKYPFSVISTGTILIKKLNNKEIEVGIIRVGSKRRKWQDKTKLTKVDVDFQCTQFLFDKGITYFYK